MRRVQYEGTTIGDMRVDEYLGDKQYLCTCKCGTPEIISSDSLKRGYKTKCTHIDPLLNKKINEWTPVEILPKSKYRCICSCGKEGIVSKYDLEHGVSKSCGHLKFNDLTGRKFGEWEVLSYAGNKKWNCRCSCNPNKIYQVYGSSLLNGDSKSCGHLKEQPIFDLKNKEFGEWRPIEYVGHNKWRCKCSCGKEGIVGSFQLRNGTSKSCGHATTGFKDLTNMQFGELKVIKYVGNQRWLCQCSCTKLVEVESRMLRNNSTKSCGHIKQYKLAILKNNNREDWQVLALVSKNNLEKVINKLTELNKDKKISFLELSDALDVTYPHIVKVCNKYNLGHLIDKGNQTYMEDEVATYIKSILPNNVEIKRKVRGVIGRQELDIYIPEKKVAIEFNGSYWHSTLQKEDKLYHQNKTIECAKQGIRLIHIFEYEWIDELSQEKLKGYLKSVLGIWDRRIYARDTVIEEINTLDTAEFLEKYHLQGYSPSKINIGLKDKNTNELLGIMTFGKSRFNKEFEYELIRMCYIPGVQIVGGSSKLFKYFITTYKPQNIICYSDITKFTGNGYLKLGFKTSSNSITTPNYIWLDMKTNNILTRYQTQKQKLLDLGYGELGDTENEIMDTLGYIKIYNSGNIRLEWNKDSAKD